MNTFSLLVYGIVSSNAVVSFEGNTFVCCSHALQNTVCNFKSKIPNMSEKNKGLNRDVMLSVQVSIVWHTCRLLNK